MEERLLANSIPVWAGHETECWEWIGNRNAKGYGRLSVRVRGTYKKLLAHRVSFTIFKGRDPKPGYDVDHKCNNRWCISPDHLQDVPLVKNRGEFVHQRIAERQAKRAATHNHEEEPA